MSPTLREFALTEIKNIISQRSSIFTPDETVARVLGFMKEADTYEVAVRSNGAHGVITVRDLLEVDQPAHTKIDRVWKSTGSVNLGESVLSLCENLVRNNVRALPVVKEGGVVGLATQMDVVSAMAEVPELSEYPAKEIIRSPVWSVDIDERVAYARRTMLERGISHVPVVEHGRLVGVVTAGDIVHTFVAPASKTTTGERVGRRTGRFPGQVTGIMDTRPCTVNPDASVLEVVTLLGTQGKSACFMTDGENKILGVLAPRDLMAPILRLRAPDELPVYVMGIGEEDFFERAVAEAKVRRVVERSRRFRPDITEVSVRIKRSGLTGERTRYELTGRALGQEGQVNAEAGGWDLLEAFDVLTTRLGEAIRRSKPPSPGRSRRGRSRR
jgi:CBS domain-containing protein/ribosome-associated translation inhibitor RaiA